MRSQRKDAREIRSIVGGKATPYGKGNQLSDSRLIRKNDPRHRDNNEERQQRIEQEREALLFQARHLDRRCNGCTKILMEGDGDRGGWCIQCQSRLKEVEKRVRQGELPCLRCGSRSLTEQNQQLYCHGCGFKDDPMAWL